LEFMNTTGALFNLTCPSKTWHIMQWCRLSVPTLLAWYRRNRIKALGSCSFLHMMMRVFQGQISRLYYHLVGESFWRNIHWIASFRIVQFGANDHLDERKMVKGHSIILIVLCQAGIAENLFK
jgi:hypothetical protein